MATSFEFLYLNKRRKTIQQVLTEHGINTVKDFELWLERQSLIASQQSTMKEVEVLCTEIVAPKLSEQEEPEEEKPSVKRKSKRVSNNQQTSDDEDIQSPLHTDQSPSTPLETN
jgi:hypothetical protein